MTAEERAMIEGIIATNQKYFDRNAAQMIPTYVSFMEDAAQNVLALQAELQEAEQVAQEYVNLVRLLREYAAEVSPTLAQTGEEESRGGVGGTCGSATH